MARNIRLRMGCEKNMYKYFFKRFFDIIFSFLGLIVAALPMLIIAIAIKIDSKGPVIYHV